MLNTSKFNALTIFGGGYYEERRQALGTGLSPRLPKGGLRLTDFGQRLIDNIGGDSYGC